MKIKNKLIGVLILGITLVSIGVIGYMYISDYTFIEALYMTIITISTVGFGEIRPSNDYGKLFSIFLILTSIGIYAYMLSVITEYIANGKFLGELKFKRMQNKIKKLKGHTIVCGYGRNGKQAVTKLNSHDIDCVIIESDKEILTIIESLGYLFIEGNATNDDVLEKAGIHNASNLIATLPSDADNLFIVLSARQFNKNATLISRASNDTSERKLRIAGADNVIMPDKLGGDHMASLVVSPDLIEFVDKLSINGDCDTNLEEILVNNLPNEFINKTLRDLDLRRKTGCSVIGVKTSDNNYIINPESDLKLAPDSKLIILGREDQIIKLHELF